eukprot:262970_1
MMHMNCKLIYEFYYILLQHFCCQIASLSSFIKYVHVTVNIFLLSKLEHTTYLGIFCYIHAFLFPLFLGNIIVVVYRCMFVRNMFQISYIHSSIVCSILLLVATLSKKIYWAFYFLVVVAICFVGIGYFGE